MPRVQRATWISPSRKRDSYPVQPCSPNSPAWHCNIKFFVPHPEDPTPLGWNIQPLHGKPEATRMEKKHITHFSCPFQHMYFNYIDLYQTACALKALFPTFCISKNCWSMDQASREAEKITKGFAVPWLIHVLVLCCLALHGGQWDSCQFCVRVLDFLWP